MHNSSLAVTKLASAALVVLAVLSFVPIASQAAVVEWEGNTAH